MKTSIHPGATIQLTRSWLGRNRRFVNVLLISILVSVKPLTTRASSFYTSDSSPYLHGSFTAEEHIYLADTGRALHVMASKAESKVATGPSFVAATRPRIILFGDSLTERSFDTPEGWGAGLASFYTRRADVINRGMSGYNTRWALQTLPFVFGPSNSAGVPNAHPAAGQVLFATVFFGANDAARMEGPAHSARQHVPLSEYCSNLKEIVSYIKSTGVDRVIIITPPPVSDKGRKQAQIQKMGEQARDWPLDRTFASSGEYSKAAAAVAKELGVPCLDLFKLIQEDQQWGERYLCDGLHFTPRGQETMGRLLQALVRNEWPDIRPLDLPTHFPAWDAINFQDMKSSFVAMDQAS